MTEVLKKHKDAKNIEDVLKQLVKTVDMNSENLGQLTLTGGLNTERSGVDAVEVENMEIVVSREEVRKVRQEEFRTKFHEHHMRSRIVPTVPLPNTELGLDDDGPRRVPRSTPTKAPGSILLQSSPSTIPSLGKKHKAGMLAMKKRERMLTKEHKKIQKLTKSKSKSRSKIYFVYAYKTRDPGDLDFVHTIRVQQTEQLIGDGYSPSAADVASRQKVLMDLLGVSY